MADLGNKTRFIGSIFAASGTLSNGDTLVVNAEDSSTQGLEVQQIIFGSDCSVRIESDADNDGTYEISVSLGTYSGSGISQGNEIRLTAVESMRLVVENTGSQADYLVTGEEMIQ